MLHFISFVVLFHNSNKAFAFSPSTSGLLCMCLKYKVYILNNLISVATLWFLHFSSVQFRTVLHVLTVHSCQALLGVNLSAEFVKLYFPYASWGLLFFRCWQRHFEFQLACVVVEGRSSVVRNTHAWLQISHLKRFLSQSVCIWQWQVSTARSTVFQSFCSV